MVWSRKQAFVFLLMMILGVALFSSCQRFPIPPLPSPTPPPPQQTNLPTPRQSASSIPSKSTPTSLADDWPQLGHDAQRSNASLIEVSPPFCYSWKWYGVPFASRSQPVISNGRLVIGGMDGVLYTRDASTGASLWQFSTGGPIRHSAAIFDDTVITGSYDGFTYALAAPTGKLLWKAKTGSSATAPLIDAARGVVYVASTDGNLTALAVSDGSQRWIYSAGAPILTSPTLSSDGTLVFLGAEDIQAIAVDAASGQVRWKTRLQGQSLADRYPVAAGSVVFYRSQPLYFFHTLLQEGDDVLGSAGPLLPDWKADWAAVKPKIEDYLQRQPDRQTFFSLSIVEGKPLGPADVLYTYGNNDPPNVPVIQNQTAYLTYRARHGIQNDANTVHVTTKYDSELGKMDLSTLEIQGVQASQTLSGPQFRMTSDEAAFLTMGGDILWVDSWERLGGVNVRTGELVHVGNVSNDFPECGAQCGPSGPYPFFPIEDKAAYPFPPPRVGEGAVRGGVVVANKMLYWRVLEAGLAGVSHNEGGCHAPKVWLEKASLAAAAATPQPASTLVTNRPVEDYLTLDLSRPNPNPNPDLVSRLNSEVQALIQIANGQHLLPFFLERGFTDSTLWPYNVPEGKDGFPKITYNDQGNLYWHDPGELLLTLAQAYPYLGPELQKQVKVYVDAEMERYPPLSDLPWGNSKRDWLRSGSPREPFEVPFRAQLNNWPPPAANLSAIYSLWLWSANTGDWSYAQAHFSDASALFNTRTAPGKIQFYADLAGIIGYYRLAAHFEDQKAMDLARQAARDAFQAGQEFTGFRDRANQVYLDPRGIATGWSAPVFFGITPEIGRYIAEQTGGQAQSYLSSLESLNPQGRGVPWWYLTRAGVQGEEGETSYLTPALAWSHFLAHAYVKGDPQTSLLHWLDRPWTAGDIYSIQKIVAALQAAP